MKSLVRPFAALSLALAAAAPAGARTDEVVEKVIDLGRTESEVQDHLRYLTDRIGPRLTGSTACTRACEWAAAQFRSYGLTATIEKWGEFPVGFERGVSTGGMVAPVLVDYVFGTNAWTAGTPGPVRGRAVAYPKTVEELEEKREALAGAWLVRLPRRERPSGSVRREIDAALEEIELAGEVRDGGRLIITGGRYRIDPEDLPTDVVVRIEHSYYTDLLDRLTRGQEVELEFDVDNRFVPGPVANYNVIADIPGSDLAHEYVVVGGHIDSWDGARGAQDNGTGVSTTMEAARLLMAAGAKPRRTIRFMLWSGEEQGLLGSRAYVEQHEELMERISAVLVHDGGTNYVAGIAGPEALVDQLRDAFEPAIGLSDDMPFEVSQNEGLSRRGASDHASFTAKGVPGFFWRQKGRASYQFVHHTQNDTFEHAVPEYQRHSATVIAIGAYNLAMADEMLDRTNLINTAGGGRGRDRTRRMMGVQLEDNVVTDVFDGTMAADAGWEAGDVILAIDGVETAGRREVVQELQKGGPRKVFKLKRGEAEVETVLDYTGTPSEKAREERRKQEAEEAAAKAAEEAAGEAPAEGAGSGTNG